MCVSVSLPPPSLCSFAPPPPPTRFRNSRHLLHSGHNIQTCGVQGIGRRIQDSNKELHQLANSKGVDTQSDTVLDLTGESDSLGSIVRPSAIDLAPPPSATRPMGFNEKLKPGLLQPGSMSCDQPSDSLIGQKVFKDFGHGLSGEYYGAFNGCVVSYDATKLYYSIEWSDGDTEEMNR